ncbi:hypothetical protein Clst_0639 [Thermoclostridium stercorarium subsp. stercorarium DSM 8532]|jgi:hypothetical protein|nr:hypothetical protein Clst_0639 [Thermoclostridium stercorarium subsp. stercorarium DSM 8532]
MILARAEAVRNTKSAAALIHKYKIYKTGGVK